MKRQIPSMQEAEDVAIKGLTFIASDDVEMDRFLALSGLDVANLRESAKNPAFLVAVLDYLMGHEPTLVKFAEAQNINPEIVSPARQLLAGPEEAW